MSSLSACLQNKLDAARASHVSEKMAKEATEPPSTTPPVPTKSANSLK